MHQVPKLFPACTSCSHQAEDWDKKLIQVTVTSQMPVKLSAIAAKKSFGDVLTIFSNTQYPSSYLPRPRSLDTKIRITFIRASLLFGFRVLLSLGQCLS